MADFIAMLAIGGVGLLLFLKRVEPRLGALLLLVGLLGMVVVVFGTGCGVPIGTQGAASESVSALDGGEAAEVDAVDAKDKDRIMALKDKGAWASFSGEAEWSDIEDAE